MAQSKTKPMGRRPIDVDVNEVKRQAALCASKREIARAIGISEDTLDRRLKDPAFEKAFQEGRANLRNFLVSKGIELCKAGNVAMIIFLLKTQFGFVETQKQILTEEKPPEKSAGLKSIYSRISEANRSDGK